jgi:hypothetical protein
MHGKRDWGRACSRPSFWSHKVPLATRRLAFLHTFVLPHTSCHRRRTRSARMVIHCVLIPEPRSLDFTPQSPFMQPPLRQPHLVDFTRDLPFALASINRSLRSLCAQEPLRRAPWHVCLGDRDYISNPTAQVCSNPPSPTPTLRCLLTRSRHAVPCRVVSCRPLYGCKREVNGRTRCMQPINTSLRLSRMLLLLLILMHPEPLSPPLAFGCCTRHLPMFGVDRVHVLCAQRRRAVVLSPPRALRTLYPSPWWWVGGRVFPRHEWL